MSILPSSVPKAIRAALLACLTLVVLAIGGFWAFLRHVDPMARCRGHRRFSQTQWSDSTLAYGPLAVRGCMVDDLLARQRLRGATRREVVAMLGEPPETPYFRDYDLVYWLGPERSLMSIDSEWLVFRLDATGRVAEHRLVTD